MHGLFKAFVPHTNKKNINLDLLRHYNTLQALRFWLDGGRDERVLDSNYLAIHSLLKPLLSGWYIVESLDLIKDSEFEDNEKSGNFSLFKASCLICLILTFL
jgi:hypothetical protein